MARQLSIEDGNLSSSILTSRRKSYSDIDLLFERKPSGDIYRKTDADAVKQSVKNIVSTNRYEKPFEIFYGANITGMLFELADAGMGTHVEDQVKSAIQDYEPRAKILRINVFSNPDRNTLQVELLFRVTSTEQEVELQTTVSRLR
jgi:phage baseplate assembly protein W|tara:strand:+ start:1170 stop:1607 length:438 start_codon:yes stop_codon:yes gene_type:complete